MNEAAQLDGLRAYAAMMNTLDADRIEPYLAEDFVYESQTVLQALESKEAFMEYIRGKLATVQQVNVPVYAELGRVTAYGRDQPCVILAQNTKENLVALVLAAAEDGKLKRIDLCIAPPPSTAQRTSEYPR